MIRAAVDQTIKYIRNNGGRPIQLELNVATGTMFINQIIREKSLDSEPGDIKEYEGIPILESGFNGKNSITWQNEEGIQNIIL